MSVRYEVRLLGRELCGADIISLRFSRPDGYVFKAGQWFTLTLETAEGRETKTFSHCSGPADEYLEMTTRLSDSAFKKALAALAVGDRVSIAGPGGRLAIADDAQRVCFLAGGVGITPIRSILRDAMHGGRTFSDALLMFGNRDDSCAPFLEEFERMASAGVRTVVVYEVPPSDWEGESGFITADMVLRHAAETDSVPFVIAGPPLMVAAMERVLDELGIPDENRHVERFGPAGK